jgi:hypothetical protein
MKKIIWVFIVCLIFTLKSNGQSFYAGGSVGIGLNGSPIMIPNNSYTGAATSISLLGGYTLKNNHVCFDVAYNHISSNFTGGGDQTVGAYSINRNRIIPTVKLLLGAADVSLYIKLGFILDLPGVVQKDMVYSTFDTLLSAPSSNQYSGYITAFTQSGVSFGFPIVIGLNFRVSENVSLFIECNSSSYHWSPSHSEVIDGGGSDLSKFTIAQKQQNYVLEPAKSNDPNQPTQVQVTSYSFSNTGLNFGLIIHFGKKKEA